MNLAKIPRRQFSHLPTPFEELPKLSRELGLKLLIKRDDQTGLALGGNKVRKLEYLIGDALAKGADTIITLGAIQSNHCRQTAAAAAVAGLRCELILNGKKPDLPNGNLFLDEIYGANIRWIERSQRAAKAKELTEQLKSEGRKPYLIPVGGSNGIGAVGYVAAMEELAAQLNGRKVDRIVFASSSGGTQAGMALGARLGGFTGKITGIGIDKDDRDLGRYEQELADIANEAAQIIAPKENFSPSDFEVIRGYVGGGYGIVSDLEKNAIRLLARQEGILLDPVYAGRAFGAFLDLLKTDKFSKDETILFWHTGGAPALFAYVKELI